MDKCVLCEQAYDFHYGLKGERADKTWLLIVLQGADKRISEYFERY